MENWEEISLFEGLRSRNNMSKRPKKVKPRGYNYWSNRDRVLSVTKGSRDHRTAFGIARQRIMDSFEGIMSL